MLCAHCCSLFHALGREMPVTWRIPDPGPERVRALLCSCCGALLPTGDSLEVMVGKLAQLARFGLDAEGRPLLELAHKDT